MLNQFIHFCETPSLRQAQIVKLGIPAHQIRVWSELLGIGGPFGKTSKWRLYSPMEVFLISIMNVLKGNLNFAFSGREKLVSKIGTAETLHLALRAFFDRKDAFVVSDFQTMFEAADNPDTIQFVAADTDLCLIISTTRHVEAMLEITALSPHAKQKDSAIEFLQYRQKSPNSNFNRMSHHHAPFKKRREPER